MEKTLSIATRNMSARWFHAITLTERIAVRDASIGNQPDVNADDLARAHRKLQRWKEQLPFTTGSFFADRLTMDNITEDELLVLLTEPIESVQERVSLSAQPNWLVELSNAFAEHVTTINLLLPSSRAGDGQNVDVLLQPLQPLLKPGIKRLQAGIEELIQQYAVLPFDPDTLLPLLLANLSKQIIPKVSRTLVLELNIARLKGLLRGEAPEERFQSYIQLLGQTDELRALLEEYCVLARQLVVSIDLWVVFSLEFLHHLCADWEQILATFTPESDPGALVKIIGGAGDTHRGGRSVMILEFGTGFQLLYKPKSLAIDVHFQELLAWLNEHGQHPAFKTVTLIDRGTYGWTEFIPAPECSSIEQVKRFYERQGGYLALLYALDATDFHLENIIASGEHPMLIDLEALFHPRAEKKDPDQLEHPVQPLLTHSVLRTSLLPQRLWSSEDAPGIDISGLGGQAGQLHPVPVPTWEGAGTDQMRFVRERMKTLPGKNRPRLNGSDVETYDYIDSIIDGFTTTYRLLARYREEFFSDVLLRFAHDEIRFVARATRFYTVLLTESFHPNMLRDALKRDRFFDRLWLGVEQQPHLARLIPAERADLLRGDVPMFTTRPDSCDLFTSGGECLAEIFKQSSLELVRKRVQQLNEDDLARQTWIIRASFTSMATDIEQATERRLQLQPTWTKGGCEGLVSAALEVGEYLRSTVIYSGDAASWLSVGFEKQREWSLMPAYSSLYSGAAGIALFLGYLGSITGETCYTALAFSALKTVRWEVEQLKKNSKEALIGAFEGLGAAIYLLSHLSAFANEPSLLHEAEELVTLLPDRIEKDDKLDIISGSAGCIASLLSLHAVLPSDRTLKVAIQCGDHLLAYAQRRSADDGWKTLNKATPQTGFAHGAAGIAWSLLRLVEVSHEERFRQAALAALKFERDTFSPEKQNWPNLYNIQADGEKEYCFEYSWCRGAPGIGLARLASLGYLDDTQIRQEIEVALRTTIAEGFGRNQSLCHGDFGNLETLLVASYVLRNPEYCKQVECITAMLLESIDTCGWVTGVPLAVKTPGLMTGLAGTGYELLRLAYPERVPSVLLLAPPFAGA